MTATTEQRVQLLQHLIDHRPISTAGPQVGLSPSEAHDIATDYGYPNRRRLTTALAELQADTEEVAEAMAEQSDAELAADPDPVDTEAMRPELPDPDDDPTPAPLELAAAEAGHGLGGARTLGQGVIATAEGPGEPGSVINWEGANYVPQPEPAPGEDRDPLYALGLTELVRRHHELQDTLTELRRHAELDNGHAATAEQWEAWWVSRGDLEVERGKASPVAATRRLAAKLDGLPAQLVAALQADAQRRAQRRAEVARLRERLAELEGKPVKTTTKTVGGSTPTNHDPKGSAVRAWAAANGLECAAHGRIPASVLEQYVARPVDA